MPVYVAQTVEKRDRQGRHRLPRWLACQHRFATACPWLHSFLPRMSGLAPERHVGRMSWSADGGVVACRGKLLAAVDVLSRPGACRSPGLAGARGAPRQVSCRALVGLPGKLLLPGSCASSGSPGKLLLPGPCSLRAVVPASSSCRGLVSCLKYFVLEWPKKEIMEGFGVPLASLAAGRCDCPCTSSGY